MIYTVKALDFFSLIGQEVELTNNQSNNSQIAKQFWKEFNLNLKKQSLSQDSNWIKYALMERREGNLFYYCAIPKKIAIPEGFTEKKIEKQKYLVIEHHGAMDKLADTYRIIYKELLPNSSFKNIQDHFLHFEKYDHRFHWNRADSIIEIYIPIENK